MTAQRPTKDLLPNLGATLIGRIGQMGMTFLASVLLARALSVEAFGIYAYALTVQGFWILFSEMGLTPWTVKTVAANPMSRRNVLRHGLIIRLFFGLGTLSILAAVHRAGALPNGGAVLLMAICSIPMLVQLWPFFDAAGWARLEAVTSSLRSAINLAGVYALLYLLGLRTPEAAIYALGAAAAVAFLVEIAIYRKLFRNREADPPNASVAETFSVWRRSLPLAASQLMIRIYFFADVILLQYFLGDATVGLYNAAYKMMFFFQQAGGVFARVSLPALAESDREGQRLFLRTWRNRIAWVAVPVVLIAMLGASWFLSLFGDPYRVAAPVLMVLTLNLPASWLNGVWGNALLGQNEDKYYAKIVALAAFANVALNLWAIPRYGMMGAAVSTLASEWLVSIGFTRRLRRNFAEPELGADA